MVELNARTALADALSAVAANPESKAGALIKRAFGGAEIIKGDELDGLLKADFDGSKTLMEAAQ